MKYIYYIAPIALVLFIGFSFFSDFTKPKKKNASTALERAEEMYSESANAKRKKKASGKSLFDADSKFLEFPEIGNEEIDLNAPLTPEEREKRRKFIIEKAKKLADMFPNNSVIPRHLSPDALKKLEETNQRMASIQNQLIQNEKVSKEDKLFYYKERLKTSKDRLEVFRYALGLENNGVFDESKLEGFLKERYDIFVENEKAYADEIIKVEKE